MPSWRVAALAGWAARRSLEPVAPELALRLLLCLMQSLVGRVCACILFRSFRAVAAQLRNKGPATSAKQRPVHVASSPARVASRRRSMLSYRTVSLVQQAAIGQRGQPLRRTSVRAMASSGTTRTLFAPKAPQLMATTHPRVKQDLARRWSAQTRRLQQWVLTPRHV
jgi:hypothetical protein